MRLYTENSYVDLAPSVPIGFPMEEAEKILAYQRKHDASFGRVG